MQKDHEVVPTTPTTRTWNRKWKDLCVPVFIQLCLLQFEQSRIPSPRKYHSWVGLSCASPCQLTQPRGLSTCVLRVAFPQSFCILTSC